MKTRTFLAFALSCLALAAAPAAASRCDHGDGFDGDWQGDTLILKPQADAAGQVAITPEGFLAIDGAAVDLDRGERRLLQDFYGQYLALEEEAALIGVEGAKLGAAGAALAAQALAKVVRLTRDDYDEVDLEREMEVAAAKIERKGAVLEHRGDALEARVDDLRTTVDELRTRIPELGRLAWFQLPRDGVDEDDADE